MGNSFSNSEKDNSVVAQLGLLLVTLEMASSHLEQEESLLQSLLIKVRKDHNDERHRHSRNKETPQPSRRTFQEITQRMSEKVFQRTFRMQRRSFFKLCALITNCVGDDKFKSETCSRAKLKTHNATEFRGGEISGELRLGLFLRLMAGSSYLDLLMIYGVSQRSVYLTFQTVTGWVNQTLKFSLVEALKNEDIDYFSQQSDAFSVDSDGTYNGCFGSIDGLAIKIKQPTLTDLLRDAGAYFSRKGFFALNCQAICDAHKRILWISSRHIGSSHDSRAFKDTQLHDLLVEKKKFLLDNHLFLVGDSAYDLESFILIPHDNPSPLSPEDAYNYYHSNCRIRIECCFGELIMRCVGVTSSIQQKKCLLVYLCVYIALLILLLFVLFTTVFYQSRWGLFWRSLKMDISHAGGIIEAAALLHNFIVDERLSETQDGLDVFDERQYFRQFSHTTVQQLDEGNIAGIDDQAVASATDNNEPRPGGRPTILQETSKREGEKLRSLLTVYLDVHQKRRPKQAGFKYNEAGMVYMDY